MSLEIEILKRREESSKDCFVFSQQKKNPKSEWRDVLIRVTNYRWRENNKCGDWIRQAESQTPNTMDYQTKLEKVIMLEKKENFYSSIRKV